MILRCVGLRLLAGSAALASLVAPVAGFYEASDDVLTLSGEADFAAKVMESSTPALVEFYAPWCGHCKNLTPEWKKAATALKGIVTVAAVDATDAANAPLGTTYAAEGYPSVHFFGADKSKHVAYSGERNAKAIASFALAQLKDVVRARLGLKPEKKDKKKKEAEEKKDDTRVVTLTGASFENQVLGSEDLWVVEFFAPWCGHCKNLAPQYAEASVAVEGMAKLGAVDCTAETELCKKYDVEGFPTLKVFAKGPKAGVEAAEFQGGRTAFSIATEVRKLLGLGEAASSEGGAAPDADSKVVTLTAGSFETEVLKSESLWLVEFFAPWCGHCKNLAPEWKKAAAALEGKVKLGAVDCTAHQDLCSKYGANSYPTLKIFDGGSEPRDFEAARTAAAIVSAAESLHADFSRPAAPVVQLVSEHGEAGQLRAACEDKSLCVLAFLPDILDTGAEGRNAYIGLLQRLAKAHKNLSISFLWSEAFAQRKLEERLGVGSMGGGYPGLAVVNLKKGRFVPMQGAFTEDEVTDFVARIVRGRERTTPLDVDGLLKAVSKAAAWDGTDGGWVPPPKTEL